MEIIVIFNRFNRCIQLLKIKITGNQTISDVQYQKIFNRLNANGTFKKIDIIMSNKIDNRFIRSRKLLQILDITHSPDREVCLVYILKSYGQHFY